MVTRRGRKSSVKVASAFAVGAAVGGIVGFMVKPAFGGVQVPPITVYVNTELEAYVATLLASAGGQYNALFDIDKNGVIDILDAQYFARHLNQTVTLAPTVSPYP